MRQTTKRIKNQPMKSPSPDISNRNVIKNTRVELDDVYRYINRKAQKQSKTPPPKQPSSQNHPSTEEIQSLKQRLKQLQHRHQQVLAENQSLSGLVDINSRLNNELSQMREILKSQSIKQLSPRKNDQPANRERLLQLMEENKRINKKLQEKEELNRQIEKENQRLQNQIYNTKYAQGDERQQIERLRMFWANQLEPEIRKIQLIWINRLTQLDQKISSIQHIQNQLQYKLSEIQKKKLDTTFSPIKQIEQSRRTYIITEQSEKVKPKTSNIHDSPFFHKNKQESRLKSQNQRLSEHVSYLDQELEKSRRKCQDLEDLLNRSKSQPQQRNESFYRSKIEFLEQELESQLNKVVSLEKDLAMEKEEVISTKDRLEKTNHLLENQMINYKKALDQERYRTTGLEMSLQEMTQKCRHLEETAIDPEENQRYKKRLEDYYERQFTKLRNYYEQLLSEKDNFIGSSLMNYLEELRNIKKGLLENNLDQIITENEAILNEKITIQSQLTLIKEEHQRIINELKRKLILQQQKIIQLQKDNEILHKEIVELHKQKQKLKKAMIQFQEVKAVTPSYSNPQTETIERTKKYNCRLKGCLKETIEKIDNLQSKIVTILKQ